MYCAHILFGLAQTICVRGWVGGGGAVGVLGHYAHMLLGLSLSPSTRRSPYRARGGGGVRREGGAIPGEKGGGGTGGGVRERGWVGLAWGAGAVRVPSTLARVS